MHVDQYCPYTSVGGYADVLRIGLRAARLEIDLCRSRECRPEGRLGIQRQQYTRA